MENNQSGKSQAELYREERKKRMAAEAKKSAKKKNPKVARAKKIAGKVIAIVLSVVIALGAVYAVLNFFGVPQKVLPAAKIGDQKVSIAKYDYYYMEMYLNILNTVQSYNSQYGEGAGALYTGFDSTKAPEDQPYDEESLGEIEGFEGENPTWADFLRCNTLNSLQSYMAYAKMARDAGITLTEEETANIDQEIKSTRETAEQNDYSLNRFLTKYYGKGASEKLQREIMEEKSLASKYAQQKNEELSNGITDEQIEAEYNENMANYALVSVSAFTVSADTSSVAEDATDEEKTAATNAAMEEAKKKADGYAAKVTSPETLLEQAKAYNTSATESSVKSENVKPSDLETAYGTAAKDWILASGRKVGDVTVVESTGGYSVLYLSALPHKDAAKPVDVRHILIQFESKTDDSGNTVALTDQEKETYLQKAHEVYDEYLKNPTEDHFAELAEKNSADSGSNTNGGLYEEVKVGDMVTEFNDWCFDPARKPGDTGIIETTYGYHIMYYVGNDHAETWRTDVQSALSSKQLEDFDAQIHDGDAYKIKPHNLSLKWAIAQLNSLIKSYSVTSAS